MINILELKIGKMSSWIVEDVRRLVIEEPRPLCDRRLLDTIIIYNESNWQ